MRLFRYTCRDKKGEMKQGELKAVSRADVLRELNAQGNIPLSVVEASGVRTGVGAKQWTTRRNVLFLVAALAMVLLVGLIWNPFTKLGEKSGRLRMAKNPATRTESVIPKKAATTPVVTQRVVAVVTSNHVAQVPQKKPSVAEVIALNASTIQVGQFRLTPTFTMAAESVMSMLLHGSPGMPGPPIPRIPNIEKRFMDCLTNNMVLYDTDSEEMAKQKEQVALLKLEFAEYMKQGYTASNIVAAIQEQRAENAKLRSDLRNQMMELYTAGQTEEAEKYRDEANIYLGEKGLPLITLPKPKQ
jgi:hypothetical protein